MSAPFVFNPSLVASSNFIEATYHFFGADPAQAMARAKKLAGGQSTEAWSPVLAGQEENLARHRATVLQAGPLEGEDNAITFTVGFPALNTEGDVATLLTMVFGKPSLDGRLRLVHVALPPDLLRLLPGPRFGIEGLRARLGVAARPLGMAIFKPGLGLTPAEFAQVFANVAAQGLDLIKDDEIHPDLVTCPTLERVRAIAERARRLETETGHRCLHVVNLTGRADQLVEKARRLCAEGARAILLNVLVYGFGALEALARDPDVNCPLFAHPALSGAMIQSAHYGMSANLLLGTLMRVAGADAVLFPAGSHTLPMPAAEVPLIRDRLTEEAPLLASFPVPSAGVHPGMAPRLYREFGANVILNAGGGVFGHPQGPAAGARALAAAVSAVHRGEDLAQVAETEPALKAALDAWGMEV